MDGIRVMLADDEVGVREALSELVASDPTIDLVGVAADAEEAVALARDRTPDVAVVDLRMPGGGQAVAQRIHRTSPGTKVLVLSVSAEADDVLSMLRAGVVGYVTKDMSTDRILRAIHRSADGQTSISVASLEEVTERLAEFLATGARASEQAVGRRIRRVLSGHGLSMLFQPLVDLDDDHVVGLEALARFRGRPRRSPEAWFADAASVGLRSDLELAAICRALAVLDRLPPETSLWINVSPETLVSPALGPALAQIPAGRVVLEMTEQSPVEDYDELRASLRPLRERGIPLAIDDVGTGFSSLGHIVGLGPDHVKLDRTLVAGVDRDSTRKALIARLVSFVDEVGIGLVAEGIQTGAELRALRSLGVRVGQGFYLGRPGPLPVDLLRGDERQPRDRLATAR